jgi:hypothetical protein
MSEWQFTHTDYGLSVSHQWPTEILYTRKSWVPKWIWKLVAQADVTSACIVATNQTREDYENRISEYILNNSAKKQVL